MRVLGRVSPLVLLLGTTVAAECVQQRSGSSGTIETTAGPPGQRRCWRSRRASVSAGPARSAVATGCCPDRRPMCAAGVAGILWCRRRAHAHLSSLHARPRRWPQPERSSAGATGALPACLAARDAGVPAGAAGRTYLAATPRWLGGGFRCGRWGCRGCGSLCTGWHRGWLRLVLGGAHRRYLVSRRVDAGADLCHKAAIAKHHARHTGRRVP